MLPTARTSGGSPLCHPRSRAGSSSRFTFGTKRRRTFKRPTGRWGGQWFPSSPTTVGVTTSSSGRRECRSSVNRRGTRTGAPMRSSRTTAGICSICTKTDLERRSGNAINAAPGPDGTARGDVFGTLLTPVTTTSRFPSFSIQRGWQACCVPELSVGVGQSLLLHRLAKEPQIECVGRSSVSLTAWWETRDSRIERGLRPPRSSSGPGCLRRRWAARARGIPAHIFLPENPNPVKRRMIEAFGATIHIAGDDIDEAKAEAEAFAERSRLLFVDDGESLDMMEGAGTIGLEIGRRLPDIHTAFVPLGGGTLSVGTAAGLKALQPEARVVAVQAKGAPAMVESFHARRPVERAIDTVADGLVSRIPARLALDGLWALADDAMTVSDDNLVAGVRTLLECAHVLVEPAGAAALAGAWDRRDELQGRRVVLILSGANITTPLLHRALDRPPLIPAPDG